jgi:hypothetical protein
MGVGVADLIQHTRRGCHRLSSAPNAATSPAPPDPPWRVGVAPQKKALAFTAERLKTIAQRPDIVSLTSDAALINRPHDLRGREQRRSPTWRGKRPEAVV